MAAGINWTCGAAISTGRFMDVETMPVLQRVQLKADATLANGVCARVVVCGREILSYIDRERVGGVRWESMEVELLKH